jgi:hypothetical protein
VSDPKQPGDRPPREWGRSPEGRPISASPGYQGSGSRWPHQPTPPTPPPDHDILEPTGTSEFVRVNSESGTSFDDIDGCKYWSLNPPFSTEDIPPELRTSKPLWMEPDRMVYPFLFRTRRNRYLLSGHLNGDYVTDPYRQAEGIKGWNEGKPHYLEVTPDRALEILIDSGYGNELPDDLRHALLDHLSPKQPGTADSADVRQPESRPQAGQPDARPSGAEPSPELPSNTLTPAAKAMAAAYELLKEGKPVSLKAACQRAGVDRKNIRERHPEVMKIINTLAAPDRSPPRGTHNRRTGTIDAVDEGDE